MTRLTERQTAVLQYIVDHPGCMLRDVALHMGNLSQNVRSIAIGLEGLNLIEETTEGQPYVVLHWPTTSGRAYIEHGSGQDETSGLQAPAVAQDARVGVPALLPGAFDV